MPYSILAFPDKKKGGGVLIGSICGGQLGIHRDTGGEKWKDKRVGRRHTHAFSLALTGYVSRVAKTGPSRAQWPKTGRKEGCDGTPERGSETRAKTWCLFPNNVR